MPIDYQIDQSRRLIVTTAAGLLTADDLLNHQIRIHNDPNFDPLSSQINDMRMADLTGLDMDCVEILSQRAVPKDGVKIAFVVRDEISTQLGRMFEGFRDGTGEEFRFFSDLDFAYSWIDSPPQRLAPISRAQNRRVAPRVSAESDPSVPNSVDFIAGNVAGTGQILNVSTSGAFVARPSRHLEEGIEAYFYFIEPGTRQRLQALGRVIRTEEQGFAVQFTRIERELEQLVLAATEQAKDRE